MSKCQKNKYAAGGKCGAMSSSADGQKTPCNLNLSALIAAREKQDALLFSGAQVQAQGQGQAIVLKKVINKSDIETVLEGDF
jgi:hypothetical protein